MTMLRFPPNWRRSDATYVLLAALAILAAQALTLAIIGVRWPSEDVAFYAATRRWASVAQPIITLGTLTLIPAWLAQGRLHPTTARSLGVVMALGVTLMGAVLAIAPDAVGRLLFGVTALPQSARWAIAAVLIGHASLGVALAVLQGMGHLRTYAVGFAATYALAPVVIALLAPGWVVEAVAVAAVWVAVAVAVVCRHWRDVTSRIAGLPATAWVGWRRVPGDIGVPLLLTAPAIFAGQELGAVAAGQFAWVGIGMAGLGTVVAAGHLSVTRYAAAMVTHGRHEMAHRRARHTIRRVSRGAWVSAGLCAVVWVLVARHGAVSPSLIIAQALQILSLAPYLAQLVARRFVDGLEERPLALRPIAWGIAAGALLGWSTAPHFGIMVSGTLGTLMAYAMMSGGMTRLAEGSAVPFPWLQAWEPGARRLVRTLGVEVLRPVVWTRGLLRSD